MFTILHTNNSLYTENHATSFIQLFILHYLQWKIFYKSSISFVIGYMHTYTDNNDMDIRPLNGSLVVFKK